MILFLGTKASKHSKLGESGHRWTYTDTSHEEYGAEAVGRDTGNYYDPEAS